MKTCPCAPGLPPACDEGRALLAAETRALGVWLRFQARPADDPDRVAARERLDGARERLDAHRAGEVDEYAAAERIAIQEEG